MKKHQKVAIIIGIILSGISFIPVLLMLFAGYDIGSLMYFKVFIFPTIGVGIAAIIIYHSFLK